MSELARSATEKLKVIPSFDENTRQENVRYKATLLTGSYNEISASITVREYPSWRNRAFSFIVTLLVTMCGFVWESISADLKEGSIDPTAPFQMH